MPFALAVRVPLATSIVIVWPLTVAFAAPVPVTVNFWFLRATELLFVPSLMFRFWDKPLTAELIALATFLAVAKPSAPVTEAAPVLASLLIVARFVDTFTALPSIVVEI